MISPQMNGYIQAIVVSFTFVLQGSSLFDVIKVCDRGQATPPSNSPTDLLTNATNGQVCPSAAQM